MSSGETTELRFTRGQAGADQIQAVIDEVLRELEDPGTESAELARAAGIEPETLEGARVSVREEQQGIDPVTTTILVGIVSGVATHVVTKLWDDVIWPRLRKRLGGLAVGEKQP